MAWTTIYYRLRIRNEDDDGDVIVISSKPGDTNALLTDAPEGDGQNIDPIMGTLEVGAYTWQAIDRYDSGYTYTITSIIADVDARNQILSNKCIGEYQTDGATWVQFHTGFLNDLKLGDAKTFTLIVGDTDRRERDAVLFKTITDTFDKVSNIIGGPVIADPEVAYLGTPKRAWGPIIDYGPARFQVIGNNVGGEPNPANLQFPDNRVTLALVAGNLPPRYKGFQGVWNGKIPNPAEYIDQMSYKYFEADAEGIYATQGGEQSQPWGSFPQLQVRLRRVSDSVEFTTFPIAQAATIRLKVVGSAPVGDEKALVANSNDWLIVAWDIATMGAHPALGVLFDGWVRPIVISEDNPLHLIGHPIDLHIDANTDQGIAYDTASAAATKADLGGLVYELRITKEWEYSEFTGMLKASAGYGVRYNADGEQEFFPTREIPSGVEDTITPEKIIGDDRGEPTDEIFRVSESSAIKGVDYKLKQFRLWIADTDSDPRPIDGVIAEELKITGTRRDESVYGSKIITFDVPGMIAMPGDADVLTTPMKLREWIISCGEVLIDRAGWGWAEAEIEVLATTPGAVGDYWDIEAPHQVNALVGQSPVAQRGGTRRMQIVSRTEYPGTSKVKVKDAGNLAQDAPEGGDGGTLDPCEGLDAPVLALAPSADNPYTIATVTLTNVADYTAIGADAELQYLVQTATPASTDNGEFFGPIEASAGEDTEDTPAILSGETIWVRGRPIIVATSQRCNWSTWQSITLGPDDEGTGGQLPPFTLALSIDSGGILSAEASSVVAEIILIYFLSGAAGGAAPLYADVIAVTPDSTPPFTGDSLASMAEGETRTVGAVGEDALGNRTLLITESITRAVNTGSAEGVPGDFRLTFHTAPPAVFRFVAAAVDEPFCAIPMRKLENTIRIGSARIQHACHVATDAGTQLVLLYSLDRFASPGLETGVYVRADRVMFPEVGDWLPLAAEALGTNVTLGIGTKNGTEDSSGGISLVKSGNIYLDATVSETPPEGPGDPEPPGDLPNGGACGNIIDDRNATTLGDTLADNDPVTAWADDTTLHPDAVPDGGAGQGSPTFKLTGFTGGDPCVEFDGANDGLSIASQITGSSFTMYLVMDAIQSPGGSGVGAVWDAPNGYPKAKGMLALSSGVVGGSGGFGGYVNNHIAFPTYENVAYSGKGNPHLYAFTFAYGSGDWALYVDDDFSTPIAGNSCPAQFTESTIVWIMFEAGLAAVQGKIARLTTYDQAHDEDCRNEVRTAFQAIYSGLP